MRTTRSIWGKATGDATLRNVLSVIIASSMAWGGFPAKSYADISRTHAGTADTSSAARFADGTSYREDGTGDAPVLADEFDVPRVWSLSFNLNDADGEPAEMTPDLDADDDGMLDSIGGITENETTVSLPSGVSRRGYRLVGWATTPDWKSVADDPETPTDETKRNVFVPVTATLMNLAYNYIELRDDESSDGLSVTSLPDGRRIVLVGDGVAVGGQYDAAGHIVKQESLLDAGEYGDKEEQGEIRLFAVWEPDGQAGEADDSPAVGDDGGQAAGRTEPSGEVGFIDQAVSFFEGLFQGLAPSEEDGGGTVSSTVSQAASASDMPGNMSPNSPPDVAGNPGTDQGTDSGSAQVDAPLLGTDGAGNVRASVSSNRDSVIVEGEAAGSYESAARALADIPGVDENHAEEMSAALFAESPDVPGTASDATMRAEADDDTGSTPGDSERQADGTQIEYLNVMWMTPDSIDNGDPDFLYRKPVEDTPETARIRIVYSLSGEHDYAPGNVTITVPEQMFHKRGGAPAGQLYTPFPEAPSTMADFNYVHRGDSYVFTNTRRLSAATRGLIEVAYEPLVPHEMVDMAVSDEFVSKIEVLTHRDHFIMLESRPLVAQFDTEEVVDLATKYSANQAVWVSADEIPAYQRIEGETDYVVATYYMYSHVTGNTAFTLDVTDEVPDEHRGFIIDSQAMGRSRTKTRRNIVSSDWVDSMRAGYQTIQVAYPGSEFDPDVQYTLHNTVTYTLTEKDPAVGDDPKKVTTATATAQVPFIWHMPEFTRPIGHFMVNKIGNDGISGDQPSPFCSQSYYSNRKDQDTSAYFHNSDNGYGTYPDALNRLRDGENVEIAYTVESIGYIMPWTLAEGGDFRKLSDYGQSPVTMVTYDTDDTLTSPVTLNRSIPLDLGRDYSYKAVEFPAVPSIGSAIALNLQPDGSFAAIHAGDGTFDYVADDDVSHIPDVLLQARVGGEWVDVARARWTSGSLSLTSLHNDCMVMLGRRVTLPEGTSQIRTSVTSTNAYIWYYIRPILTLRSDGALAQATEDAFAVTRTPSMSVQNSTYMRAYDHADRQLVDIHKREATDYINGYTTDVLVYPKKTGTQMLADVDTLNKTITIHYHASVCERTFIPNVTTYKKAIESGQIVAEEQGVWYDLLPKGIEPVMSSIRLREDDSVTDVHTVDNYKGSGRTLLVVKANLSNSPEQEVVDNVRYWQDSPSIWFDATCSIAAVKDYGDAVHNVIAFESLSRAPIGSVAGYSGEYDDPTASQTNMANGAGNIATNGAFIDDPSDSSARGIEMSLMTGLDPDHAGEARFVYAGTTTSIDYLSEAQSSLTKDLQVNHDGRWSKGTYEDKRTVYEGGWYGYRLSVTSAPRTQTRDIVIYDSLENFVATDGNDDADIGAARWRGTLTQDNPVDVSQLKALGIAPVVYYSTVENLALSDETNPNQGNATNLDLSNASVWKQASDYDGDMSAVKAIAIDASKMADGSDFTLDESTPVDSISVLVNMHAPHGTAARNYIQQKGAWGDSAMAYNNAYMTCTSVDLDTQDGDSSSFVRYDYTKVGLEEFYMQVTKVWDDDGDRDGIRPESVTVRLLANGEQATAGDGTPFVLVLDEGNGWAGRFDNIPYTDEQGVKINYSVSEDPVEGYVPSIQKAGREIRLVNRHVPARISISGTKTWSGDTEEVRPSYIRVVLMASTGESAPQAVDTKIVYPDDAGEWRYSFDDVYRYEGGKEIAYSLSEKGADSYVPTIIGTDIANSYHPYGDVEISKEVRGIPEGTNGEPQAFPVIVELTDDDGNPLTGIYRYEVLVRNDGQEEQQTGSGTMSNGDILSIHDGETIRICELPEGTGYKFTEQVPSGYEISSSANMEGTVIPNDTQRATLTNDYHALGYASIGATKTLSGRGMSRYQFRFSITDMDGNIIRNGANLADGTVTFGDLRYTEADANQTYHYKVVEVDRGRAGYTYDDTEYVATVRVTDNGDGTLTTSVSYEGNGAAVPLPSFENSYHASGSISLRAWKILKGGQLQANQFAFKLVDEDGTELQTKRNAADGLVLFDPIPFDEGDVGKTFKYAIYEAAGSDQTVTYSEQVFGYAVTVADNDDGTLTIDQRAVSASADVTTSPVTVTLGDEAIDVSPVFVNTYKPGSLSVTKATTGDVPAGHEDDEFKFKVQLSGEDLADSIDYSVEPVQDQQGGIMAGAMSSVIGWLEGLISPTVAYADTQSSYTLTYDAGDGHFPDGSKTNVMEYHRVIHDIVGVTHTPNLDDDGTVLSDTYSGSFSEKQVFTVPGASSVTVDLTYDTSSSCHVYVIDGEYDGTITSNLAPSDTVRDYNNGPSKKTISIIVPSDTVTIGFTGPQWWTISGYGYFATVRESDDISVVSGTYKEPTDPGFGWFTDGLSSPVTSEEISRDATLTAHWDTMAQGTFHGLWWNIDADGNLVIGDGTERTIEVASNPGEPYPWRDYSAQVTSARFDGTLHVVGSAASMFSGMSNMTSCDLKGLNVSQATTMANMFYGCESVTALDFSGFDFSSCHDASDFCYQCRSLTSIDLHDKDFSQASTSFLMAYCDELRTVNIRGSKFGGSCSYLVEYCPKLELLDMRDTTFVQAASWMIYGAGSDSEWFEVQANGAKFSGNLNYMFRGSSGSPNGVRKIDFTGADFSGVTSINYLVSWNDNLETILMPEANLTSATSAISMLAYCPGIEYIDIHGMTLYGNPQYMCQYTGRPGSTIDMHGSTIALPETVSYGGLDSLFMYHKGISHIDMSDCDFSQVRQARQLFYQWNPGSDVPDLTVDMHNTKFPVSCQDMFRYALTLTDVNLDGVDTSAVANMDGMFADTPKLEHVDFSSFDFSNVGVMRYMFNNAAIKAIDWSGKVFRSEGSGGGSVFDGAKSLETLDLSGTKNFGAAFVSSTFYGDTKLWKILVPEGFDFARSSLPEPPIDDTYDGQWLHVDDGQTYTSSELMSLGPTYGMFVWLGTPVYKVRYMPNGARGNPVDVYVTENDPYSVAECPFDYYGRMFLGYATNPDGTGDAYAVGQGLESIATGTTLTLYAQWSLPSFTADVVNGSFEITIPAGYVATVPNLPAGTSYSVYEESPKGWVLVTQSGISGTIMPMQTSAATFTNQYQKHATSIQLVGTKTMDNRGADAGAFSFELTEGDTRIQKISNTAGGGIVFDAITYDEAGDHSYIIKEVPGGDSAVTYDTHAEVVTVSVTESDDGSLSASVGYDDDGIRFFNRSTPGRLRLTKNARGLSAANEDDEFTFEIRLTNENGEPLDSVQMSTTKPSVATGILSEGLQWLTDLLSPHVAYAVSEGWEPCGDAVEWQIDGDGTLVLRPTDGGVSGILPSMSTENYPWASRKDEIRAFSIDGELTCSNMKEFFKDYTNLKRADLNGLVASGVTNMASMFKGCTSLMEVDGLAGKAFSNPALSNASYMFSGCTSLETIDMSGCVMPSLSNCSWMFEGCSGLRTADLSGCSWTALSNCATMFSGVGAEGFAVNLSGAQLGTGDYMFSGCTNISYIDASGINLRIKGSSSSAMGMFYLSNSDAGVPLEINLQGAKLPADCEWMFSRKSIQKINLRGVDTSCTTDMHYMFYWCDQLTELDVSSFDTSNVTDFSYMFNECSALKELDLRHFDVRKGQTFYYMFQRCNSMTLNISGWELLSCQHYATFQYSGFKHLIAQNLVLGDAVSGRNWRKLFKTCENVESIDVSGSDFSGISMDEFFRLCTNLKTLNLSNVKTTGVHNLCDFVSYCPSLTSLDLSGWDTSSVTNWASFVDTCPSLEYLNLSGASFASTVYYPTLRDSNQLGSLRTIVVSDGFPFSKTGITHPPTLAPYTGYWRHVETGNLFTAEELPELAIDGGTYVWDTDDSIGTVVFDANGGSTPAMPVTVTSRYDLVEMPTASRTGFVIDRWSTSPDGSGEQYEVGRQYDSRNFMGRPTVLYAQWKQGHPYTMRLLCENPLTGEYDLRSIETRYAEDGTTQTIEPPVIPGFVTPDSQVASFMGEEPVVIEFRYDIDTTYSVTFDGNGADYGWMDVQVLFSNLAQFLNPNRFAKIGALFLGWSLTPDGSVVYTDGQSVVGIADPGSIMSLFAQWMDLPTSPSTSQGTYIVKLHAGEVLDIPNLPAGTTYDISETDIPAGWFQSSATGLTGTILAGTTSEATVTNDYEATGQATIQVWKELVGRAAKPGEFSFSLRREDGSLLETVSNSEVDTRSETLDADGEGTVANPHQGLAPVTFSPLEFSAPGTYRYEVSENQPSDSSITWDTHVATMIVTVTDAGHGNLTCSVSCEDGRDVFTNRLLPGALTISKSTAAISGEVPDSMFEFDIELRDEDGRALSGTYDILGGAASGATAGQDSDASVTPWSADADDQHGTIEFHANGGGTFPGGYAVNRVAYESLLEPMGISTVLHTGNLTDRGLKLSDYTSNAYEVCSSTIPGAAFVGVDIDYSTPRGQFYVWKGDWADAIRNGTSVTFTADCNPDTAFKTYAYDSGSEGKLLHDHLDVPGDSVTILYMSYALPPSTSIYNQYSNYGMHAALTGMETRTRVAGGSYGEPTSIRPDTRCVGWYLDPACTDGQEFDLSSYAPEVGQTIKAYAKWVPTADATNGHMTVSIKGGESVTIGSLPAGATYHVTERETPGWEQIGAAGTDGTIVAGGEASAHLSNLYSADGMVSFEGTKRVLGEDYPMAGREFSFVLLDADGGYVATGTNETDGSVSFPGIPLSANQVGSTVDYTVREVEGDIDNMRYDGSIADVSVTVSDDGSGHLTGVVRGESVDKAFSFENEYAPPVVILPGTGKEALYEWLSKLALVIVVTGCAIVTKRHRDRQGGECVGDEGESKK